MPLRRLARLLPGMAAGLLLVANTAAWTASTFLADLTSWRRLWEDLAFATNAFLEAELGPPRASRAAGSPAVVAAYRQVILEKVAELDLKPHQFWRTVRARPFLPHRAPLVAGDFDDAGRAALLGWGFRALGGIAPFLVLWLGTLLALPVLLWTSWEFGEAGRPWAGGAYLLVAACSPFVVESLALARSAVGFYVLAVIGLVPLAVYAVLGPAGGWRAFAWRAAAASGLFALCASCRGGVLLLFPGFALALLLACERTRRRTGASGPRALTRLAAAAAVLAAFLAPFYLLRPAGHHDVWSGVWEGLGDFDRSKGHAWSDPAAEAVVVEHGSRGLRNADSERILRAEVLRDVRESPGWYAAILVKRVGATVALWKLWPWGPRDGIHLRRATSPNEGLIDKYYGYTATADHLGWGRTQLELPITAVVLPTLAWLAWVGARGREAWRPVPVLIVVALGTLGLPIVVTTASGQETQSFAFVYFLGFAFLVEELARTVRTWTFARASRKETA
jgi:hypothetical protein